MKRLVLLSSLLILPACNVPIKPPVIDCRLLGCPNGSVCQRYDGDSPWACAPAPTPTPTPTPEPTPTPVPTPVPTPTPTPTPTPSPSSTPTPTPGWETQFPVRFPLPSATLDIHAKRYNAGVDATLYVVGDDALCVMLHGPVGHSPCHFDSVVWTDKDQRADYEGLVMAGAREGLPLPARPLGPVWEYQAKGESGRCHDDQVHVNTSCDHFGNTVDRDDPQTHGVFEGKPSWLSAQSDEFGPYAGFFTVPQTSGKDFGTLLRACLPLGGACSPWLPVDWR